MESIKFYKKGKIFYELKKIDNIYILRNLQNNTSKAFDSIPPQLENLLPEGINRELLAIRNNISVYDEFNLLKFLDDTFSRISTNNNIKNRVKFDSEINCYEDSIKYIEDFEVEKNLLDSIEYDMASKKNKINLSYLSGQQPKSTIIVHNNHIRFAKKDEYSNAILKYSNKYHLINLIENMLLNFAKFELKFDVMPTFLLIDKQLRKSDFLRIQKDIFITKRFDSESKDYFEINALLGYTSKEKYDLSVEEIFEKMQIYLDKEELLKLAKYYYFNFLVGNGDSHSKNFSVIKDNGFYKLSPLYDVVNTHIYNFEYSLGISLYKNKKIDCFSELEFIKLLDKFINTKELLYIKTILNAKILEYINKTPFIEFENGEKIKEKLIKFYNII